MADYMSWTTARGSQSNLEHGQGRHAVRLFTTHDGAQMSVHAGAWPKLYLRGQKRSLIKARSLAATRIGEIVGSSKPYILIRHVEHLRDWTSTTESRWCRLRSVCLLCSWLVCFLSGPLAVLFRESLALLCVNHTRHAWQ